MSEDMLPGAGEQVILQHKDATAEMLLTGSEMNEANTPENAKHAEEFAGQIERFLNEQHAGSNPKINDVTHWYSEGGLEVYIQKTESHGRDRLFVLRRRDTNGQPLEDVTVRKRFLPFFQKKWSFSYHSLQGNELSWIQDPGVALEGAQKLVANLPKPQ